MTSNSPEPSIKELLERIQYLKSEVLKYKIDKLTGLRGITDFDAQLSVAFESMAFENTPFMLIMVDADNLHNTNRLEGREAGDLLLQGVAKELLQDFPKFDSNVYRISGDEFCIITTGPKALDKNLASYTPKSSSTASSVLVDTDDVFPTPSSVVKEVDRLLTIKKNKNKTARL